MQHTNHTSSGKHQDPKEDFWLHESIALLALAEVDGVGYWTLWNLAWSGTGFKDTLKSDTKGAFVDQLTQAGARISDARFEELEWLDLQEALWKAGQSAYQGLKRRGIQLIHWGEPRYPSLLRTAIEPPRWLFVQGDPHVLHEPGLGIVGTRSPSENGLFLARYVGACLAHLSTVTISGLASGIDQIAHRQSIRFDTPTVAVLGTGILLDYPAKSRPLREEIVEHGGAVVTEYLPNQSYSRQSFVRRNRIQAGLSRVVIPVEWRERSGTAHTVRYAAEARRHIVCLRMPDWSQDRPELVLGRDSGASVVTIPGEEELLLRILRRGLSDSWFAGSHQLTLWEERGQNWSAERRSETTEREPDGN